jgi:hypothetical protein
VPNRGTADEQARMVEAVLEARRTAEARCASKDEPSEPEEQSEEPAAVLRVFPRLSRLLEPWVPEIEIPEVSVEPISAIPVVIVGQPERQTKNTIVRGKLTPFDTFWAILDLAVQGESARKIAKATDERGELVFVNRIKTGYLVRWVKAHPKLARRALDRHELPREFRATPDGVLLPAP